jgi:hypothetical protein
MNTYRSTGKLEKKYQEGEWREGTQRNLVAAAFQSQKSWTVDSLATELDGPPYWETVRRKGKDGKPLEDSWLMMEAGGVRGSVIYHLNGLSKDGLLNVVEE